MCDQQRKVVGCILIGVTTLNMMMCLNLYRTYGELMYQTSQLDSNINSAIQSLSRDVWEMKQNQ